MIPTFMMLRHEDCREFKASLLQSKIPSQKEFFLFHGTLGIGNTMFKSNTTTSKSTKMGESSKSEGKKKQNLTSHNSYPCQLRFHHTYHFQSDHQT